MKRLRLGFSINIGFNKPARLTMRRGTVVAITTEIKVNDTACGKMALFELIKLGKYL